MKTLPEKEVKKEQPKDKTTEKAKETRKTKKSLAKDKDFINDIFKKAKKQKAKKEEEKKTKEEEIKRIQEETRRMRQLMKKDAQKFAGSKTEDPDRKCTEDGLPIFTMDELNIGKGGNTDQCPFDCKC